MTSLTSDAILDTLGSFDEGVRAMVVFGLRQALEDVNTATAAGHGYSRLPLVHDKNNPQPGEHRWALLREDNVRLSYDYRFMETFSPHAMRAESERTIDLLLTGDPDVVRLIVQRWGDRKGFDPEWEIDAPNGREYGDRSRAIEDALRTLRDQG